MVEVGDWTARPRFDDGVQVAPYLTLKSPPLHTAPISTFSEVPMADLFLKAEERRFALALKQSQNLINVSQLLGQVSMCLVILFSCICLM